MEIRFIKENEIEQLVELCVLHAAYEKADYVREGKSEKLKTALFKETPDFYCMVAVENNRLLGYTSHMLQYSTWDAQHYTYLDCIFLLEEARGKRLGEKLMFAVMEEAKKIGAELIQWQTPDFNYDAIRFYKRIGASSKSKERFFWIN